MPSGPPPEFIRLTELLTSLTRERNYEQAIPVGEQILGMIGANLGETSADYARCSVELGRMHEHVGDLEAAWDYYWAAMKIYDQNIGRYNEVSADVIAKLASLAMANQQFELAASMYEQLVDVHKEISGESHKEYASMLTLLASAYQLDDKWSQAEELYKKSIGVFEQAGARDHQGYSLALTVLANHYRDHGNHAAATPVFKKLLDSQRGSST